MFRLQSVGSALICMLAVASPASSQSSNAEPGERLFRLCAPCHSLQPDRNMTGPSLHGLWNRKAGGLARFDRYSPALTSSGIVWNDQSLDGWIADPQQFIPGNTMTFRGMKDERQRAELLAFLKEATRRGRQPPTAQGRNMGGMMGANAAPNLKRLEPDERVTKIVHCRDTYRVTTADGQTRAFWERNLRFKTDVSADGPEKGMPALVPAGMMGDRANVVFAAPEEITRHIVSEC